ncbi:hypothetical protein FYJ84_02690 [Veillonellaceae bacterium WCA-693-APC-5D-A]|uniref:Uncharacterized protein n=1 Tax=Anaerovibrio slackiae TaxID=2652309 RepID=A0A6I2UAZ8_9FIRM|nr:hypothetical protein [Anaerovibrio slackiae]MSU07897.1 hypothetical protein [Anaerovibrio slackiae]
MGNFELKDELIKVIKNRAIVMEMMNLQMAQDRRTQPSEMLNKQINMIKTELAGEKEKLL